MGWRIVLGGVWEKRPFFPPFSVFFQQRRVFKRYAIRPPNPYISAEPIGTTAVSPPSQYDPASSKNSPT